MIPLNRSTANTPSYPVRMVQFGEGNFLRAFIDWFIDSLNKKADFQTGVSVVQPIEQGMVDLLSSQDGLYHLLMQGIEDGELLDEAQLISCIQEAINPFENPTRYYELAVSKELKLIVSNTTEAGIVFDDRDKPSANELASTFPGKVVQFLQKRFEELGDSDESEIGIIPCELVEANGERLKKCIDQYLALWSLPGDFKAWITKRVHFANTLVDRIVPGYPSEEIDEIKARIGYDDRLVVKAESFHLFVIEGDDFIQEHFPAHKHGFNVKYVESITPYRTQKVRILNGAHTSMVPVGLLAGIETVRESVEDDLVSEFVKSAVFEEIVPTIDLPGEDPKVFAEQVLARFKNPFIRHELMSISLNSISKWRVRVLPTVLDFLQKKGQLPTRLVFSLTCLIKLHVSGTFDLKDDDTVLDFFRPFKNESEVAKIIHAVLSYVDFWGQDLTKVDGFTRLIMDTYREMEATSITETLKHMLHERSVAYSSK